MGAAPAFAQRVRDYRNSPHLPSLYCDRNPHDPHAYIHLLGAPSEALVFIYLEECEEGVQPPFETTYHSPKTIDPSSARLYDGKADLQGRVVCRTPRLDNPEWAGRLIRIKALVQNPNIEEGGIVVSRPFAIMSPSLYFSSFRPESGGRISRMSELERRIVAEIEDFGGRPGKPVFNRDCTRGFVMLDQDRIAVFDNLLNQPIHMIQTGIGLVDIALTPDGRKLIALTTGVIDPHDRSPRYGTLWVYDTQTFANLDRCVVDTLTPGETGNHLAISMDSSLVFIREADMMVGEYNLLSQHFQRIQIGDANHFGGELQDIQIFGNGLLALSVLPDQSAFLHVLNTQNYRNRYTAVGRAPMGIKRLDYPEQSPLAFILDRADENRDILWKVDIYAGHTPEWIPIPDGALDFDVTETCRLAMILYPGRREGEGLLRFLDLDSLELSKRAIPLKLKGPSRILLSRSHIVHSGYVYSSDGEIILIDLDAMEIDGRILLEDPGIGGVVETP